MNMSNWYDFLDVVGDIISHEDVQSMVHIPHHLDVSCYEHSVFVAYTAFVSARRLGLDSSAVARAGLLHDLYLYSREDRRALPGWHFIIHPREALKNARAMTELTKKEQNIILSHMWPLPGRMPRSREAVIVNLADKYCALMEAAGIWHSLRMRLLVNSEQIA